MSNQRPNALRPIPSFVVLRRAAAPACSIHPGPTTFICVYRIASHTASMRQRPIAVGIPIDRSNQLTRFRSKHSPHRSRFSLTSHRLPDTSPQIRTPEGRPPKAVDLAMAVENKSTVSPFRSIRAQAVRLVARRPDPSGRRSIAPPSTTTEWAAQPTHGRGLPGGGLAHRDALDRVPDGGGLPADAAAPVRPGHAEALHGVHLCGDARARL